MQEVSTGRSIRSVLNGVRGIERLCRPLTGALEAVRHTAGARQHGWAAYLEERERIPAVAASTLSPFGSRFLGQVRENGLGL